MQQLPIEVLKRPINQEPEVAITPKALRELIDLMAEAILVVHDEGREETDDER
jgi:hypothetical protein